MDLDKAIVLEPLGLLGLVGGAFVLGLVLAAPLASLARRIIAVRSARSEAEGHNDRLANFLRSDAFAAQAAIHCAPPSRAAPQRDAHAPDTMLRADIDAMPALRQIWGEPARKSAIAQVADVLRRGVRLHPRHTDQPSDTVETIAGEGFVIIIRDGSEKTGSSVARRLMRALARTQIKGTPGGTHLTASFGIAERLAGESYTAWRARAEAALRDAKAGGVGEIVEARVADPVKLLPAPASAYGPAAAPAKVA